MVDKPVHFHCNKKVEQKDTFLDDGDIHQLTGGRDTLSGFSNCPRPLVVLINVILLNLDGAALASSSEIIPPMEMPTKSIERSLVQFR